MIAPCVAQAPSSREVPRSLMSGGLPPVIAERIFASLVTGVCVMCTTGWRCSYWSMAAWRAASSWPPPHCCHIVSCTTAAELALEAGDVLHAASRTAVPDSAPMARNPRAVIIWTPALLTGGAYWRTRPARRPAVRGRTRRRRPSRRRSRHDHVHAGSAQRVHDAGGRPGVGDQDVDVAGPAEPDEGNRAELGRIRDHHLPARASERRLLGLGVVVLVLGDAD